MSRPHSSLLLAVAAFAALVAPRTSLAQGSEITGDWVTVHNGRVRLLAARSAVTPSGQRLAAVEVQLAPGWKTYWRNPGEAGIPPSFEWAKSKNVEPSKVEVLYPAPKRIADAGGELIGYTGAVMFPVRVSAIKPEAPVELALDLSLGICREVCIPVETTLSLSLPATPAAGAPSPLLAAALEGTPRPLSARATDPTLVGIKGTVTDAKGKLLVTALRATDLFLEGPEGVFVPLPDKPIAASDPTQPVTFVVDLAKAPDIKDALGKPIRLTFIGPNGASEAVWIAQ